ncbi:MarR family transcriptional regulator [Streptomyces sp. NPDC059193]|uniref:MarR family transcriptional regulator n=1 Tax=Streptomyces sp. NPDC059193 TaxID=3346763 RepID=UPI00368D2F19
MDKSQAWSKVAEPTKSAWQASATGVTNTLDKLSPAFAPFAQRWDEEADRRTKQRTTENLKALIAAQREHNSAGATARTAQSQRRVARKQSKNPLSGARRAAATADRAAGKHKKTARESLKAARKNYPHTLKHRAVQAHAVHSVPAAVASYLLSTGADWATWPATVSAALIGLNVVGLALGRRTVSTQLPDGLSAEERHLMERLDPAYWVEHAEERGLAGTVTTVPTITTAGIECDVRLDGQWSVKKLRAAMDSVRALLGAPTALPMLVVPGTRGGWGVIRLRTRSAAPDGIIRWRPGDALGVDMVTGEDVDVPLGLRMLIAGTSGAGKSTASRPLLYKASDGTVNVLVIIDLKKVEGRLWDHRARVASNPVDVVELVEELVAELDERLDVLPKGQATLIPTAARPRITVVVDEGAEVMSHCQKVEVVIGYTEKGAEITAKRNALDGLDSIARMGRAACIDLWWMTQSPTYGDGVPRQIAKQLGTRLGLTVESPTEARVVFGESAQEKGWKADELPMPGVAMLRDGKRTPDPIKVRYITDEDVIAMPRQPIWSRGQGAAEAPAPVARPALRIVKDEDFHLAPPAPAAKVPVQSAAAVPAAESTEAKVLEALQKLRPPVRQVDIVNASGLPKGTVSKAVKRLVETGVLVREADGTVAIKAAGEVSA